jgi:hypothetical protein
LLCSDFGVGLKFRKATCKKSPADHRLS